MTWPDPAKPVTLTQGKTGGLKPRASAHSDSAAKVIEEIVRLARPDAVAHRVVHGGPELLQPRLIEEEVRKQIESASKFAPLRNPAALAVMSATRDALPDVRSVAVFDTGFFASLPEYAARYAIEPELADRLGIRRYGFHGLAHRYMAERFAALSLMASDSSRFVTLQLGSGCSMAAIRGGVPIETSMGLTPLEGLMMETRSGDVDPSLAAFIAEYEGGSVEAAVELLNQRSGLLAISDQPDMPSILAAESMGDPRAVLALEMFLHRISKYLGAYTNLLGGIGENSASIRGRAAASLAWQGLHLDSAANAAAQDGDNRISSVEPAIVARGIAMDEETMLATEACRLLSA